MEFVYLASEIIKQKTGTVRGVVMGLLEIDSLLLHKAELDRRVSEELTVESMRDEIT